MAEAETCEAVQVEHRKRHEPEPNEEFEESENETTQLGHMSPRGEFPTSVLHTEAEVGDALLETLEKNQCGGLQMNSDMESNGGAELQDRAKKIRQENLAGATPQGGEAQPENHLQSSICTTSLSELSPTSVTQSISSSPSQTVQEQRLSPRKANSVCMTEYDQQNSSEIKTLSVVPIVKAPSCDGYNWRKYGQKQVKSPKGSRSYYKCTYSNCSAKKIECSDHSGHVIEIVNKGMHSHDPPRKNNCMKENRHLSSAASALGDTATEQPIRLLSDSDPSTCRKVPMHETPIIPERKRQNSSGSDGSGEIEVKEEQINELEAKKRVKKGNSACADLLKHGKKPKFVVHAAGDVGISGDGYRWRKYGQKMVKGNPNPRNYYRCTSAGCPVRKHIETAVDNTSAVIITYKGVHDHDMPVPKKRHGLPSAPLVAAAAPASMNNMQFKKTDTAQNQKSSTQWSLGTEGELTGEALDLGGEKAIESARTLLSIGFEIKPC